MAVTWTSTGSAWQTVEGTNEEVVNALMTSGVGTLQQKGFSSPAVGSKAILLYI